MMGCLSFLESHSVCGLEFRILSKYAFVMYVYLCGHIQSLHIQHCCVLGVRYAERRGGVPTKAHDCLNDELRIAKKNKFCLYIF